MLPGGSFRADLQVVTKGTMKLSSLLVIDVLGAAVALGCAGAGLRYGLLKPNSAPAQINDLSAEVEQLEETLVKMRAALDGQRATYSQREATLGERDLLPENTPVERDLRAISDLAQENRLELNDFTPVDTKRYPGVLEVRYRLRSSGRFADYLGFLRGFQGGSFWADIARLKLVSTSAETQEGKSGELIICLYSGTDEDAASAETP